MKKGILLSKTRKVVSRSKAQTKALKKIIYCLVCGQSGSGMQATFLFTQKSASKTRRHIESCLDSYVSSNGMKKVKEAVKKLLTATASRTMTAPVTLKALVDNIATLMTAGFKADKNGSPGWQELLRALSAGNWKELPLALRFSKCTPVTEDVVVTTTKVN
jgi:hypothetical protein